MQVVEDALERADCRPRGSHTRTITARCPAHEDRTPSLTLTEGNDGRALLHCHAGCDAESIVRALELEWADLFPEDRRDQAEWTPVFEFEYHGADGGKLFKVVRFPGKNFRQQRWTGSGWEWGMQGVTRQLYRLPEVLQAKARGDFIFVCEGEKDAEAVVRAGQCATCNPGGAGKWEPQYTQALTGARVVILADDDEPGHAHAELVYRQLWGKADKVGIRLPAEGHKDAAAHLLAGLSLNGDLRKWQPPAANAPIPAPSRSMALTAAVFASTAPSANLDVLGPLFQRSARTVIGAQTGEGKTTLALQAVKCLVEGKPFLEDTWRPPSPGRALIVDLEQGHATLKRRLVESGLDTSERVDILWEPSGIALDSREEDRAWVHDVLTEGRYDLVVIDPLYQIHAGSGNDELVAGKVMSVIDEWIREFNCAFLIPMHMRKPHPEAGSKLTKHDIAGSGSWLRPIEVVLGLQVMSPGNSRLWFFKDRNGEGPALNSHWWLSFDREQGFKRTRKEEQDKVKAAMRELLKAGEGVTAAQLMDVEGATTDILTAVLKTAHELGGRYRNKSWGAGVRGQTSFMTVDSS